MTGKFKTPRVRERRLRHLRDCIELIAIEVDGQCRVAATFHGPNRLRNATIALEASELLELCEAALPRVEDTIVFYEDEENRDAASKACSLRDQIKDALDRTYIALNSSDGVRRDIRTRAGNQLIARHDLRTPVATIVDILDQAQRIDRAENVAAYLIAATLQLRLGEQVVSPKNINRLNWERPGSFVVGDAAFEVLVGPPGSRYVDQIRTMLLDSRYEIWLLTRKSSLRCVVHGDIVVWLKETHFANLLGADA